MAKLTDLTSFLSDYLEVDRFSDPSLNGLQVQGNLEVRRLLGGVSASMAVFREAQQGGYDAVLVHHGLIWDRTRPIVGPFAERLRVLLSGDISLLAYHLPLDAHPIDGNNAQIGLQLGLGSLEPWGSYRGRSIGCLGRVIGDVSLDEIVNKINTICKTKALVLGSDRQDIRRVAICSGSGGSLLELAINEGVDVFVTGEPGEPAQELAREAGMTVIGAGHYNTERFGVLALVKRLSQNFGIETNFHDIYNPI